MTSTSWTKKTRAFATTALIAAFWLALWFGGAWKLDAPVLLPSPLAVAKALARLVTEGTFWLSLSRSFANIALGMTLGTLSALALALLAWRFALAGKLIASAMSLIRTVPVVSFIIVALLWVDGTHLSILISFLMVLPILWSNMLQGLQSVSAELLEMAQTFGLSRSRRARWLYWPSLAHFLQPALSSSLGLAWKSGVAAEVIGLPSLTIGSGLYTSKILLETPELFAWTAVIVVLSLACEATAMALLRRLREVNQP